MRHALVVPVLVLAAACTGGGGGYGGPAPVESILKNAAGQDVGRVTLRERSGRVEIRVRATGMPPGEHGVHLHQAARCEGPAFQSAGGHLNPAGKKHGRLNPEGAHLGDLGNLTVGADGRADVTLGPVGGTEAGLRALLGEQGIALVIHADRDDERTDPTGNSGARIACAELRP
ncbi:MAG TPA: superoxide dismutase family protein [Gemmatimonadales bacterium]|jgi:Cu-Zn family superoxide dismutase|nr:superoxide dismutase family protein [Gemmatimonadales bacterium]